MAFEEELRKLVEKEKQKWIDEGKKVAFAEAKLQMAHAMIKSGMMPEKAAEITGLPLADIVAHQVQD